MTTVLGVLASGNGSNMQAIAENINNGKLDARIEVVITDRADAGVIKRARSMGIDCLYVDPAAYEKRELYDEKIAEIMKSRNIELVVLAGFMRLVSSRLLSEYPMRVINIHPALLPSFPGTKALSDAFEHGVKVTGVTVHFVDEGIDSGPIILQEPCLLEEGESLSSIEEKIHCIEHRLFSEAVRIICENRIRIKGRRVEIIE